MIGPWGLAAVINAKIIINADFHQELNLLKSADESY